MQDDRALTIQYVPPTATAISSHVFQRPCYDRISPNALSQITALYNLSLEGLQQHTRQYKEPLTFNIAGWHPCEESERFFVSSHSGTIVISIHALRMEGDPNMSERFMQKVIFQSTPSAGRATRCCSSICLRHGISIHALRMEGDRMVFSQSGFSRSFQSTPSAWRATYKMILRPVSLPISIHALRMEGDQAPCRPYRTDCNFNPRPPHGGRRRARPRSIKRRRISIHALRMEGDSITWTTRSARRNFNPRPPHGGRPHA